MIAYHDDGTNPTLASMLPTLSDADLEALVREILRAFNDATMRKTLPSPDVVTDARAALYSGRLTNSLAASVRRCLEALTN